MSDIHTQSAFDQVGELLFRVVTICHDRYPNLFIASLLLFPATIAVIFLITLWFLALGIWRDLGLLLGPAKRRSFAIIAAGIFVGLLLAGCATPLRLHRRNRAPLDGAQGRL